MKKVMLVLSLAFMGGMSACKVTELVKSPTIPADSVVSVVVTPTATTMTVGQQQQFTAEARNAVGEKIPNKALVWSSSDVSKASVTTGGMVTAVATGAVVIRATVDGVVGQSPVAIGETPVSTVVITPNTTSLLLGQSVTPRVELRGPNNQVLTNRFVQWSSSNSSIATVSQLGVITTVNVGTVTISATSEGKVGTMTLTVSVIPAAQIQLTETTPFYVGRNSQVALDVRDINGVSVPLTGRNITWSTNDPSVASVSTTGVVRGLSTGTVSIAALVDGKLAVLNSKVSVVDVDTITITPSDTTPLLAGFTRQFAANAFDKDGLLLDTPSLAGRVFFWASETPNIAVVSNTGLVTGVSEGEATIRVTMNGKVTRRKIKIIP